MVRIAVLLSMFAGCVPPSATLDYYAPVYYVPLAAYPPPPFPGFYGDDQASAPVAEVQLETPSLAVRVLAGKISEAASIGDCASAIAAGDELEKVNADSHHAMLAIDQRYAACIRGF